jgi:hypothetical protein
VGLVLSRSALANPIAHFATIARGVLVKGAGLDVVYPNLLVLAAIAGLLVGGQRVAVPPAAELT